MRLNSIREKILTIPSYIKGNRFGYGIRLFFRKYIKIPLIISTKRGSLVFLGIDQVDDLILKDLNGRLESVYFPPELIMKENDIVFDVGGHHGIFAVELASFFPNSRIFSFEPDKNSCRYFKFNRFLNRNSKIKLIEAALDISTHAAYIIKSVEGSWGNFVEQDPVDHADEIKAIGVEQVLDLYSIKQIKYAKFNAEGAEFFVLPELFRLKVYPELILLFAHPEKSNVDELLVTIYSHSYSMIRENDDKNRPWFLFRFETKYSAL